jgi:hypothetical protein
MEEKRCQMGIVFDKNKLKEVDINEVRPNTWNPKDKDTKELDKIRQSIRVNGQLLPIFVRENKGYEIIDGEQRYVSCKLEGYKTVLVYDFGELEDKKAKALTVWFQQQVPFDKIEEAYLVMELARAGMEIPFNEKELEEMKDIAEFDWESYRNQPIVEEEGFKSILLRLLDSQYEVIMEAIHKTGESNERAIELICADFLAK